MELTTEEREFALDWCKRMGRPGESYNAGREYAKTIDWNTILADRYRDITSDGLTFDIVFEVGEYLVDYPEVVDEYDSFSFSAGMVESIIEVRI